ncbi:hypothetical protein DPMN_101153 [Dreissena polymorpha]|uniref:Uncharacterized protein n=1 Tax=Dreissena polymorpha TaxID=45954 RepID=A0A9D4R9D4_DREPO|nr:hypothetical protein DPMN_101153 [Dreissena polymorpha]
MGNTSANRENDCVKKLWMFCKDHLKISDPKRTIHIDRAHRIGKYQRNKTRPIVAKVMNTNSILCIKNALKSVDLRRSQYKVTEQYPAEVLERPKALVDHITAARRDGKIAVLHPRQTLYRWSTVCSTKHDVTIKNY